MPPTTRLEDKAELVANAVATAEFGTQAEFQFPSLQKYHRVRVFRPAVESVTLEQMTRLGEELIARITKHTPEILCEGGVTKATGTFSILNSRGGQNKLPSKFLWNRHRRSFNPRDGYVICRR